MDVIVVNISLRRVCAVHGRIGVQSYIQVFSPWLHINIFILILFISGNNNPLSNCKIPGISDNGDVRIIRFWESTGFVYCHPMIFVFVDFNSYVQHLIVDVDPDTLCLLHHSVVLGLDEVLSHVVSCVEFGKIVR